METFYIKGGSTLQGSLEIPTAKNAILPILASTIMNKEMVVIKNSSYFTDVLYMLKILENLGCKIKREGKTIQINCADANNYFIKDEYTKKIRSSIFMLGPLLSRFKKAKVAYPGGCNIGNRPIDLHLKGLRELNVKIEERHGYIHCDGKNMKAGAVHLDFPSVGATENIMMASIFLKGTTTIYNSAKEPEIVDLQNFINAMGGKIVGAGTSTISITGINVLKFCEYTPISDRIISGTYLIAVAMAGGKVRFENVQTEHNLALITKLKQSGCKITTNQNNVEIFSKPRLRSIYRIETQPFPGFPTDLQNQILALQTISRGTSMITENLFETRFKISTELMKMGANITINNRVAFVKGVSNLYGANVTATDLRGGAGLVMAGLVADGYTTVEDVYHIDRGYLNIEEDFCKLNAEIRRLKKE